MKKGFTGLLLVSSLFLATPMLVACNPNGGSGVVTGRHYEGVGEPPAGLGEDGDTYTDTETGNNYVKQGGTWVLSGESGVQNYSGEGEPDPSLGKDGDKYTDTLTGAVYEKQGGVWVLIKRGDTTYTVTWNLNGGHFSDGSTTYPDQIVREGRWITAPSSEPIKEHTTFLGWYASGSSNPWEFSTPVYGNVNLVAQYSVNEEDKITITVDPNNGEAKYTYETFVGDYYYPSIPSKTGYSFVGWMIKSTGETYNGYVTSDMAGDTLVAQWEKAKFNVTYQVEENNEVTITGIINIESVTVDIPNVINGRKVTKISSKAFNSRIYIRTIYIPENVKVIEDGAFRGTRALTEINVDSNNLNYVSKSGILYTKDMTVLVCHPTKAGTTYSCPGTLKKIGAYAFYDAKDMGITTITLNEGLEEIGDAAFYMNETMTSITFPSTLKKIGARAFYGPSYASDEDDYSLPQGVLKTVGFNEGLEEIGEMAFVNQYFENTFSLPSTVKTLGDYAFANCTAITKFVFPKALENYGKNVFAGATGILELGIEDGNTHFKVVDNILYTFDMKTVMMCPSGRREAVTIPDGVTALADYAFYMCDNLTEYHFPNTLKTIGVECFAQTYDLQTFVIPDSVTEIGHNCFDLSGLTSITIGSGLTSIPEEAFIKTKLSKVTIPGNVKTIGDGAFSLCSKISSLTLGEGVEEIGVGAFYKASISSLAMPSTLKSIGENAFIGCSIKELNVGKSLESIGVQAFASLDTSGNAKGTTITSISVDSQNTKFSAVDNILYSKDQKTVYFAASTAGTDGVFTLPSNVLHIADYAFAYCSNFTSFTFNSKVEDIGEGAFMYTKFKTVEIPGTVKTIGEGAFYFGYQSTITFNEGLEEIGDYAFSLNDLTAAVLPNSLKKVGYGAFNRCLTLASVTLGTGLTEIGDFAFADNKIKTKISIPAGCTSIGEGAFSSTVSTYGQSISSFEVDSANTAYSASDDGKLLMSKDKTVVYGLAGSATAINLPNTVTTIANYGLAANQCKATSLAIPSSLTTIGYAGMAFLMKVGTLNIPTSVTSIGQYAFAYWGSSQSINFACTRDYALTNFANGYLYSCNANVTYAGE